MQKAISESCTSKAPLKNQSNNSQYKDANAKNTDTLCKGGFDTVNFDKLIKKMSLFNPKGFRYEGEAIFKWLVDNGFLEKNLYIICGDRHWQYHAMHPSGIEEFSTGALVDNNSRPGRLAGDPKSTDPEGMIKQFYIQGDRESASGGFLLVTTKRDGNIPIATFQYYDENGNILNETKKLSKIK